MPDAIPAMGMPRQETNLIVFNSMGKQSKPEMRSHWIRVYPVSNAGTFQIR